MDFGFEGRRFTALEGLFAGVSAMRVTVFGGTVGEVE